MHHPTPITFSRMDPSLAQINHLVILLLFEISHRQDRHIDSTHALSQHTFLINPAQPVPRLDFLQVLDQIRIAVRNAIAKVDTVLFILKSIIE